MTVKMIVVMTVIVIAMVVMIVKVTVVLAVMLKTLASACDNEDHSHEFNRGLVNIIAFPVLILGSLDNIATACPQNQQ